MAKNTVTISDEVREKLVAARIDGNLLRLNGMMDPKLYKQVDKVLQLLGGKWNTKQQAHMFKSDPSVILAMAIEAEGLVDSKKQMQQFFTPAGLARRLVRQYVNFERLNLTEADAGQHFRVMEPSCGDGVFLDILKNWFSPYLYGVELDPALVSECKERGHKVVNRDFLTIQPKPATLCDLIVMNPPFTGGQDIAHVTHAFSFLKPEAQLLAIVSPSYQHHSARKYGEFRELVDTYGSVLEEIETGSFKESGTNIRTVLLELHHPDF